MDKFNSFASQAKAKAEQGRQAALAKMDGHSSSSAAGRSSTAAADSAPPPPPSRGSVPTPPRARASSNVNASSSSSSVFVGISESEKQSFFGLLDEYFQSRPQYRHLMNASSNTSTPTTTSTPYRAATAAAIPPAAPASRPLIPPTRKVGLGTARALYDFQGDSGEDLSFNEGDIITVLAHDSDDWWRGSLNGQTGIFPAAYVQME